MPGFLYYVPRHNGRMDIETARALPCAYAFGDCKSVDSRGVLRGPEEQGAGVIIARSGTIPDADMGLFLDRQKWVQMKQSDIWIGWNSQATDAVPPLKPVDLARPRQIDGRALELGDGNEWLIPVARRLKIVGDSVDGYCALPMVSKIQDNGTWSPSGVRAKFAGLWKITCEYLAAYIAGHEGERGGWYFDFEYSRMHDCACLAIGTNYYLGRDEITILELLDNEVAQLVMNELVDMPTFEEFANSKKNASPPDS